MKTLIIILLFVYSVSVNAQPYHHKPDSVIHLSEMSEKQLYTAYATATGTATVGIVLTAAGVPALVGGLILNSQAGTGQVLIGAGLVAAGIGIPLWISGTNRQNRIMIYLSKFDDTAYIPSIGIKITF